MADVAPNLLRLTVRIKDASKRFLTVRRVRDLPPVPEAPRRLRRITADGRTGRGTGRGGKDPAAKLTRKLKTKGRRADFVRFIGDREVSVLEVRTRFAMTPANVNGYLTNLRRDHGIGYGKESGVLRLVLPPGSTWRNIWES
jgi:hypothetical protein